MKLAITQRRGPREAAPRLHHRKVVSSGPRAAASSAGAALHPVVQAKLKIGAPNDEYEQEADRVADTVKRSAEPVIDPSTPPPVIQRKCACGGTPGPTGECEECRKKRESEMLQRKATHPSSFIPHPSKVPPVVHEVLRSPGQAPRSAQRRSIL